MVNIYIAVAISLGFGICTYWWGRHSAVEPTIENVLGVLEKGKLLESLKMINPDCRNVNFAVFGVSLATINFVLSFVISSVSYYLYSNAKN